LTLAPTTLPLPDPYLGRSIRRGAEPMRHLLVNMSRPLLRAAFEGCLGDSAISPGDSWPTSHALFAPNAVAGTGAIWCRMVSPAMLAF
jgi:hypothetical protein